MEIINRKARYDYFVLEEVSCGIVLTGTEIKSLREGRANIKDSYGIIRNGEMFLLNMHINHYENGNIFNHDEDRTRKLLLHKKEIFKFRDKVDQDGCTLVPLRVYLLNGKAKVVMGLCKGKKNFDKRETIKNRDVEREMRKNFKYN